MPFGSWNIPFTSIIPLPVAIPVTSSPPDFSVKELVTPVKSLEISSKM